jgi:CDP-glucose 4,6-dehydratase
MEDLVSAGFWAGKRVLVTGHTGFKGSWLGHWLGRLGARVTGFSQRPETPSLFAQAEIGRRTVSIEGDVRDLPALERVFAEHRPEIVLHLAAQALVRRSYREPVATFGTNVMGTVNVLEASRRCPTARAVVIVTSDKCYAARDGIHGHREDEPMGGPDPYSASKGCAELVATAYRSSFSAGGGPAIATVRAGNVIGGGDWSEDRLIPDIMRGIVAGTPIVIRNPRSTRPWQHVLEPLAGYLGLCARLWEEPIAYAEAWNFGPSDEAPVPAGEIARRFVEVIGAGTLVIGEPSAAAPREAEMLALNSSKARTRLGFRPRLGIDQAIAYTARFYRAILEDPRSAQAMLDRQIDDYGRA